MTVQEKVGASGDRGVCVQTHTTVRVHGTCISKGGVSVFQGRLYLSLSFPTKRNPG